MMEERVRTARAPSLRAPRPPRHSRVRLACLARRALLLAVERRERASPASARSAPSRALLAFPRPPAPCARLRPVLPCRSKLS